MGRRAEELGQTLVIFVIFLVVCIMFLGVIVDGGMYFFERREMQGTADASALAAVRELPGSTSQASASAQAYTDTHNASAGGNVQSIAYSDSNRTVTVTVRKSGTTNFGAFLGIANPEISARATARVQMMGPRPGMLPMAFMKNSYTIGDQSNIKFTDSVTGNHGPIAPDAPPACNGASGADDFRDFIKGKDYGGMDACATPIAETLPTEPGQMAGAARQGFDGRLTTNTDSFEEVFSYDAASGNYTIEKPDSPRIGIVPIIENMSGGDTWPEGRSDPIRIIAYMMVYIGKRDDPPAYPAYTNNGKDVWVTPVRSILPADFEDGAFVDFDSNLHAPVVYRLVD